MSLMTCRRAPSRPTARTRPAARSRTGTRSDVVAAPRVASVEARPVPPWAARVSAREAEVLQCVARGLSNAEVAAELFVSTATVKTHVARLLEKVGVRDRVQLVVEAYRSGYVPVPHPG